MLLSGKKVKKYVDGIIHEETQLAGKGVDLTVNSIAKPGSATDLDFGGGEEKIGELEEINPKKRNEEDKYGWWNLKEGLYIIDFNEEVDVAEATGTVVPLARLTKGGSFHGTIVFSGRLENNPVLSVSSAGLNLKENARISRLLVRR